MASYRGRAEELVRRAQTLLAQADQTHAGVEQLRGYVSSLRKRVVGDITNATSLVTDIERAEEAYRALEQQIGPQKGISPGMPERIGTPMADTIGGPRTYTFPVADTSAFLRDMEADEQIGLTFLTERSKYYGRIAEAIIAGRVEQVTAEILHEVGPLYTTPEVAAQRVSDYIEGVRERSQPVRTWLDGIDPNSFL